MRHTPRDVPFFSHPPTHPPPFFLLFHRRKEGRQRPGLLAFFSSPDSLYAQINTIQCEKPPSHFSLSYSTQSRASLLPLLLLLHLLLLLLFSYSTQSQPSRFFLLLFPHHLLFSTHQPPTFGFLTILRGKLANQSKVPERTERRSEARVIVCSHLLADFCV